MRRRWTIFWAVVSGLALAAPPLIEHLKTTPLGTGYDCRLTYHVVPNPSGKGGSLALKVGDTNSYYFFLQLKGVDPKRVHCTAKFTGLDLSCEPSEDQDHLDCLEIRAKPAKPGEHLDKFKWASGDVLTVAVPDVPLNAASVQDWCLDPDGHPLDSLLYQRRRQKYEGLYWIPAVISIGCMLFAAFKAEPTAPRPKLDGPSSLRWLIDDLTLTEDEHINAQVRQLLNAVAGGSGIRDTVNSMGLDFQTKLRVQALSANAVDQLQGQLQRLILDLQIRDRMLTKSKPPPPNGP